MLRKKILLATRRSFLAGFSATYASLLLPRPLQAQSADQPPKLAGGGAQFTLVTPARPMPVLKLTRVNGKAAELAPKPGKTMLLHFWATWCDACGKELSQLEDLQKSFANNLEIAAIAHDGGGPSLVAPFLRTQGIKHLDIYIDPDGLTTAQATQTRNAGPFVLYGTPMYYFISPHGRIFGYIAGAVDWKSAAARALINYVLQQE